MDISWEFSIVDLSVVITVIIVIGLIWFARYLIKKSSGDDVDKKLVREKWEKIEGLLDLGKEMNYKLAVIEGDKLLDYTLKAMCLPGKTMAERLKIASYKFPRLKQVWWAHQVRNHIVHDVQYTLSAGEAKKVLMLFGKALKELNYL